MSFVIRVLHDHPEHGFKFLSSNLTRKIVMFFGPSDSSRIMSLPKDQILQEIGYTQAVMDHYLKKGEVFKVIVVPDNGECVLADWNGLKGIIKTAYENEEDIYHMICFAIPEFQKVNEKYFGCGFDGANEDSIKNLTQYYNSLTGFDWNEVLCKGISDERYMSLERLKLAFKNSNLDLKSFATNFWYLIRLWMMCELYLLPNYSGLGKVMDEKGNLMSEEYFTYNRAIQSIKDFKLIDI